MLEGEYPKLLKLILDLERRVTSTLSNELSNNSNCDQYTLSPIHQQTILEQLPSCLVRALHPFETAYLSRSVSRLFDRVTLAFSTSTTAGPDTNELNDIIQTAANELAYATVHHDLLYKVSGFFKFEIKMNTYVYFVVSFLSELISAEITGNCHKSILA